MELTKKQSLELYHYCTSVTDALRPMLNTPDTPEVNTAYWIDTLTRFKKVIESMLGIHSNEFTKIYTSILTGLLSSEVITPSKQDIPETISIAYNSAIAVFNDLESKRG